MHRYSNYKSLLLKSYDEAVTYLLNKYGPAMMIILEKNPTTDILIRKLKILLKGSTPELMRDCTVIILTKFKS